MSDEPKANDTAEATDVAGAASATETAEATDAASAMAATGAASATDATAATATDVLAEMPDEEMLYDLADLFKVFADTTRIRILFVLMEKDCSVAEIAEAVGVSQSAVSHQLRTLKQAHLVKFQRDGKQIIYSLSDSHVNTMLSQGLTHICE